MSDYCDCEDMRLLLDEHDVFTYDDNYGWVLNWMKLSKENNDKFNRVNRYGMIITFCPFCGKKIKKIDFSP